MHNTGFWSTVSILKDGFVRPSAVSKTDSEWLLTPGFHCRASLCNSRAEVDQQRSFKETFQKAMRHSNLHDHTRPLSIFGLAFGRQSAHCTIPQGGVIADDIASHLFLT